MNELKVFSNTEFGSVRTTEINGEIYFVGKDVAEILGYANASKALADHVDDEDKLNNDSLSSLGQRGGWLINESGLYSLVLSSKLESAKKFKRWITTEVLPSIRKNGSYELQPKSQLEVLQLAVNQLVEQERKTKELELKTSEIENRLLKVESITITEPHEYYTIAGYANIRGKSIDTSTANKLGKYASKLSRTYGYEIGKVHSETWGTVNTYHLDILKDAFRGIKDAKIKTY